MFLMGDNHNDKGAFFEATYHIPEKSYLVHVGDLGIGFGAEHWIGELNPEYNKVIFGNHDNYNLLEKYPHNLGRFGIIEIEGKNVFFVGGANSIDKNKRIPGLNWWDNEQLSYAEADKAISLYEDNCQDIELVLSHDCPINVGQQLLQRWPEENLTNKLLYELWKIKEPKQWFFGHHHKSFQTQIGNTCFRCLGINEVVEI